MISAVTTPKSIAFFDMHLNATLQCARQYEMRENAALALRTGRVIDSSVVAFS